MSSDAAPALGAADRLALLRGALSSLDAAVVAFSGGADSALVAKVATDVLGPEAVPCVTAVSPSLAPEELEDCRALAAEWGLRWTTVDTGELDDPRYVANGPDRCYRCKTALLDALAPWAGHATVLLGVNADDLTDHRPGQVAAVERGARFPLVEACMAKADVRAVARLLGLRTWDKPAAACLASRLPHGTPVTLATLRSVAAAESALRRLGFGQLRVRHHGDLARVELCEDDLPGAVARRCELVEALHGAGYRYVALDLEGFRSGSMNPLPGPVARAAPVPVPAGPVPVGSTPVAGAAPAGPEVTP